MRVSPRQTPGCGRHTSPSLPYDLTRRMQQFLWYVRRAPPINIQSVIQYFCVDFAACITKTSITNYLCSETPVPFPPPRTTQNHNSHDPNCVPFCTDLPDIAHASSKPFHAEASLVSPISGAVKTEICFPIDGFRKCSGGPRGAPMQ